jgi:N-acetylmuramate 1-kinase
MSDRAIRIERFLAYAGWGGVPYRLLAADASFRRYHRLENGDRRAVLMDAPPPREDVRPYLKVADLLHRIELSAPRIDAADVEAGLLLLEDFGDRTYTRLLAEGHDEVQLYALAIDTLIALQHRFTPAMATDLPRYDRERLLAEAALLVDWYLPAVSGTPTPESLREEYLTLWAELLAPVATQPTTLVLRDYHVDNLMLLEGRTGIASCGLLDFQDAVLGSPAYDLVSLLEDARRDVPEDIAATMLDRYLAAFPALDQYSFATASALLAAQRNCKILGIFVRLSVRDGKPQYLAHIPRLWRLVDRDLAHPALSPLGRWLDRHIPPDLRRIPQCEVRQ